MKIRQFRKWGSAALAVIMCIGVLTLYGCATLGKDECLNADWFSIGVEDGARGKQASYISKHRKACAKHGVAPDFAVYEKGRQKGLEEYCTPRNGYRQGKAGRQYNGVCPQPMEAAFVEALNRGRDLYLYSKQVNIQKNEVQNKYRLLDDIERDLADAEDELVAPGVSPMRRRQLLDEVRMLEADQRAMLNDIADAEQTLGDMQQHLNSLHAQNPYQ